MLQNEGKLDIGNTFKVLDENDQEQEMKVLGYLNIEDTEYVAVSFIEDIQEDSEEEIGIFFFRVNDENNFVMMESEEEFERVSAAYIKLEKNNFTKQKKR
ncbi:DUF1292 domain-containing protein [Psychrobacillus psychrodurans]|jgi:hypothetical protein|uniref:DUF1292 domain-containing protein n=1 Tax=Psychrobacillus TaxID=1221880 RepID=UPI0008F1CB2C|nr:DUF1292 domain-containing protein [Psychrobacillus psychrodurans]MCK1999182.1 DUF1292 domain-containing protein [Psychrobacillus psychrodurans]MCZ8541438.1 DUF1292 domain-containing protein [Psychrobacillus psychrodurans]SFM98567.1 Protein of unknown function [Psychrobacillus psychrodurans]